jgi:enoyl-CoA hydratase/carnithine racemase
MTYQDIGVEVKGRVGIVTLQRPETGNTISDANIIDELEAAIGSLNQSGDVSVVVVTGGGRIFSAGGNLRAMRDRAGMFAGEPADILENYRRSVQRITRLMASLDVVTIAAVNGAAIGAGCDLALMCDLRIASSAARFGETFINLGLIPGDGGAWFLARLLPHHFAADLIFTGRTIDAGEAYRMGLINEVVAPEHLMERALEVAGAITSKPWRALRLSKRLLRQANELSLSDFLEACAAYQAQLHHTDEHRAAVEALLDKKR